MKALGSEIKNFYETGFPEGCFHDGYDPDLMDDKGNFTFSDLDMVDLSKLGDIVGEESDGIVSFSVEFNRWKRKRTTAVLIVEVPVGEVDTAKERICGLGYKVR